MSDHVFHIRQQGNQVQGTNQGEFVAHEMAGSISGSEVRLSSNIGEGHGAALSYRFTGKMTGDTMAGTLNMGEYLKADWTAVRHVFGRGNGA